MISHDTHTTTALPTSSAPAAATPERPGPSTCDTGTTADASCSGSCQGPESTGQPESSLVSTLAWILRDLATILLLATSELLLLLAQKILPPLPGAFRGTAAPVGSAYLALRRRYRKWSLTFLSGVSQGSSTTSESDQKSARADYTAMLPQAQPGDL